MTLRRRSTWSRTPESTCHENRPTMQVTIAGVSGPWQVFATCVGMGRTTRFFPVTSLTTVSHEKFPGSPSDSLLTHAALCHPAVEIGQEESARENGQRPYCWPFRRTRSTRSRLTKVRPKQLSPRGLLFAGIGEFQCLRLCGGYPFLWHQLCPIGLGGNPIRSLRHRDQQQLNVAHACQHINLFSHPARVLHPWPTRTFSIFDEALNLGKQCFISRPLWPANSQHLVHPCLDIECPRDFGVDICSGLPDYAQRALEITVSFSDGDPVGSDVLL